MKKITKRSMGHSIGYENITKLLLDNKADVNALSEKDVTQLHLAVKYSKFHLY